MSLFDYFVKLRVKRILEKTNLYQHLDAPPKSKEEKEYIDEWRNRSVPKYIRVTVKDMLVYTNLPYDFTDITAIDYGIYRGRSYIKYLIDEKNQKQAIADILSLNLAINNAALKYKFASEFVIRPEYIRFYPKSNTQDDMETDDYSHFEFNPSTANGRQTKHPLKLYLRLKQMN